MLSALKLRPSFTSFGSNLKLKSNSISSKSQFIPKKFESNSKICQYSTATQKESSSSVHNHNSSSSATSNARLNEEFQGGNKVFQDNSSIPKGNPIPRIDVSHLFDEEGASPHGLLAQQLREQTIRGNIPRVSFKEVNRKARRNLLILRIVAALVLIGCVWSSWGKKSSDWLLEPNDNQFEAILKEKKEQIAAERAANLSNLPKKN
eukprot:TRINITY_DN5918_c0_g1_i1.p1 TRINITY_DN5918_c0_g1~~TRINITY_DN5918_c0_g1_i1.p1  ORF type:complete len:239 (-),score=82.76 TRINITY_DN5918_c0_g1_i1:170-787(-)